MTASDPRERVRVHTGRAGFNQGLSEAVAGVAWAIVVLADAVKELKPK